jgi:fructose-1,6-bisphosphatase/sedoheptulose 1,7-bisphosphatase-like protein
MRPEEWLRVPAVEESMAIEHQPVLGGAAAVAPELATPLHVPPDLLERMVLTTLQNATAAAALAAAHARGRDNRKFADALAVDALRTVLNKELLIPAEVVIGEGERDEAPMLYIGERLGPRSADAPRLQIAVDPLEGTNLCARGEAGAIAVIAAVLAGEGRLMGGIDGYGNKLVLGPELAEELERCRRRGDPPFPGFRFEENRGLLDHPLEDVIGWIAAVGDKPVTEIVAEVLERPRNQELVHRLRAMNVQIKLIRDGDITAGLLALDPYHDVDVAIGIGAAPEGVITAALAQVYRGYMEMRWWIPPDAPGEEQRRRLEHMGVDIHRLLRTEDLAVGNVMFALTAVTANDFIPGVRYERGGGAITHTVSGRKRSGTINLRESRHRNPPPPPAEWPAAD